VHAHHVVLQMLGREILLELVLHHHHLHENVLLVHLGHSLVWHYLRPLLLVHPAKLIHLLVHLRRDWLLASHSWALVGELVFIFVDEVAPVSVLAVAI
jgi:hypothetical protein